MHIYPNAVDAIVDHDLLIRTECELHLHLSGLAPFHDVSGPISIWAGLIIRVMRCDCGLNVDGTQVVVPEQCRFHDELWHHHFHALMGISDRQPTLKNEAVWRVLDLPVVGA